MNYFVENMIDGEAIWICATSASAAVRLAEMKRLFPERWHQATIGTHELPSVQMISTGEFLDVRCGQHFIKGPRHLVCAGVVGKEQMNA